MVPYYTPYHGPPPVTPLRPQDLAMSRGIPGFSPAGFSPLPFASASQPGTLPAMLPTLQKLFGVAQTVTPMVKQYYPLVKQLPTLWRMFSALQNVNDDSVSSSAEDTRETLNTDMEPYHSGYYSAAPPPKLYI